jgi:putative transposase
MPWRKVDPMDSKIAFVSDVLSKMPFAFSELCRRYNISRKTGYKIIKRYQEKGVDGLKALESGAHSCPHKTPRQIEDCFVALRKKHPRWGAKKLLKLYQLKKIHSSAPAQSTVCCILKRNGRIEPKRPRPHLGHPGRPTIIAEAPNQLWATDFKGEFKTLDGIYCYPLTISDTYSRFILACQGLLHARLEETQKQFIRVFEQFGLPERIRSDNGYPFASVGLGRLSRLSIWWMRLGIIHELIEPASPQQNGKHERMHKTLKAETTKPPQKNIKAQQKRFDQFLEEFNYHRPHEALNQEIPTALYRASNRQLPSKIPPVEYPGNFEVRRVSNNGGLRWNCKWIRASQTLAGEYLGFETINDGLYDIYFCKTRIGRFDERNKYIESLRIDLI